MKRHLVLCLCVLMILQSGCGTGANSSGDRVLVSKLAYETNLTPPQRFDVVVFKYPEGPVDAKYTPKNYIKRLWGLPGQLLAFLFGRLFSFQVPDGQPPLFPEDQDSTKVNPLHLWKFEHARKEKHQGQFKEIFDRGDFQIVRKPPEVMLEMRRIVHDNDHQAKDLKDFPRWQPSRGSGWEPSKDGKIFTHAGKSANGVDWLRYRNLTRPWANDHTPMQERKPELISDFMDYNGPPGRQQYLGSNWVGDLMLECDVKVEQPTGEFWMELSKGIHRFRASFNLASGECTLFKVYKPTAAAPEKIEELDKKPTSLKGPGSFQVRFANIDARLTVWVNRELPFGDGKDYPPPEMRDRQTEKDLDAMVIQDRRGPRENDLEPASVGSKGARVEISHLRLWRDTYFTVTNRLGSEAGLGQDHESWTNPKHWEPFKKNQPGFMYVQPGHYLVLGDNSTHSADSREWGLVPERLMLGRALVVYFPLDRAGVIR